MGKYLDIIDGIGCKPQIGELSEVSELGSAQLHPRSLTSLTSPLLPVYDRALQVLEQRRPDRVAIARWEQALVDARSFLVLWGDQAAALGWTVDDLFMLDPVAPLARYDNMGLLWTLQGQHVVALTAHSASIEMRFGRRLTYYRRSSR